MPVKQSFHIPSPFYSKCESNISFHLKFVLSLDVRIGSAAFLVLYTAPSLNVGFAIC